MKKLLAILLSITMLLGCVVVAVNATGSDEKVVTPIEQGETYFLNAVQSSEWFEDGWNPAYVEYKNDVEVIVGFGGGDTVEYTIDVATAGTYDFTIIYTCMWEENRFTISVDGVEAGTVTHYPANFIDLETPVLHDPVPIELTEGEHTIKITFSSVCVLWGIEIDSVIPPFEQEVEVDNQGAEESHGLTITNNVGGLSLAYQFRANAAFNAFSAKLGYLEADKNFNVSITKLFANEPIQTWSPNGPEGSDGSAEGMWVSFELDEELPAGEYIVAISPTADTTDTRDIIWKKYAVADANGLFESVSDTFDGEKETARNSTPAFKVTFTEKAADDVFFGKAGTYPTTPVDVAETGTTTLNIIENGLWYENNLEADEHKGALTAGEDRVQDFRYGDAATFTINVTAEETYKLTLSHIWAADSNWILTIDNVDTPVTISATPDWGTVADADLGEYTLTAGVHTIKLTCDQQDSGQHIIALNVVSLAEDEPEDTTPEDTTVEDTTAEDTTAEDTTAEDTTAEDTTAEDTTAADTTAADTTAADTTAADTTAADTTAAGTTAAGTTAAGTTAAAANEGCKAVVGSMSAIALVAIASAAAVVLKKKED